MVSIIERIKRNIEYRRLKKKLVGDFMREHGEHIPRYSPKGTKLEWDVYVYKVGRHDEMTGEFEGEYRVGISQSPPSLKVGDRRVYTYDIETKTLKHKHGVVWG